MRTIKFKKVGMENFCCYKDPIEIQFEEGKLVLICGPNGIGKSSLFDSIPFTLYGVTPKGARPDEVVNTVTGKNCKTWLDFSVDGNDFSIERYHKYTKIGSTVLLKQNGVDIAKGHREVKVKVDQLLIPEKLFLNTLLFGQKVKTFFTDLKDSEQKDIFRKILSLDNFTVYSKVTGDLLTELGKRITEIENQIQKNRVITIETSDLINWHISEKDKFYREKEDILKRKRQSLEERNGIIANLQQEIQVYLDMNLYDLKKSISDRYMIVNSDISGLMKDLAMKSADIESRRRLKQGELTIAADKKREEVSRKFTELLHEIKESFLKRDSLFAEEITRLKGEKTRFITISMMNGNQIEKYNKELGEVDQRILEGKVAICPTCKQVVTGDSTENLKKHISETTGNIRDLEEKNRSLSKDTEKIALEIKRVESERKEKELQHKQEVAEKYKEQTDSSAVIEERLRVVLKEVENLTVKAYQNLQFEHENKQRELIKEKQSIEVKLKEVEDSISKMTTLSNLIRSYTTEVNMLDNEIKDIEKKEYDDIALKASFAKLDHLTNELKVLTEHLENEKVQSRILDFWKYGFSSAGIPSMLIDEAIPFMNKTIATYLEKIAGGRYVVSFDTLKATKAGELRDKISVNVLDTITHANSRVQLSGGQTRLVDIATILTLCDLQSVIQDMKFNILLFDEIFDSLDDENIMYVSKLLRSLISKEKSIFIISHRHIDQIEANDTLRFM